MVDAVAADHDAVVGQEENVSLAHDRGDPLALRGIKRQSVVAPINGDSAMKAHGILGEGGVEAARLSQGQGARVGHVAVEHTGLFVQSVHGRMDKHGGGFNIVAALEARSVGIDQDNVGGLDLRPEQSPRVDQKATRPIGQLDAEMIADAFTKAMVVGGPQGQGKVLSQGLD